MIVLPKGLTGKHYAKSSRNSRSFFEKHIRAQIAYRLTPQTVSKRAPKPGFKIIPKTLTHDSMFSFSAYYRGQRVPLDGSHEVIEGPETELDKLLELILESVLKGNFDDELAKILAQNPVPLKSAANPASANKKKPAVPSSKTKKP